MHTIFPPKQILSLALFESTYIYAFRSGVSCAINISLNSVGSLWVLWFPSTVQTHVTVVVRCLHSLIIGMNLMVIWVF